MTHAKLAAAYLAAFRREGLPFSEAWVRMMHALPRGARLEVRAERREWVAILRWSKPAWRAAYEGRDLADILAEEEAARERYAASRRAPRATPADDAERLAVA